MGKCEICGKSTKRDYSLCSDCYELFQIGEIVQCEECDTYHNIDKPCPECGIYESLPKEGFTECVLCGNKTKGYAFCKECWEEHDDEDLLEMLNDIISERSKWKKCPDCGEIFDAFSICDCKASKKDELTCIICGEPSNGKHFCLDCYNKYKNKVILLKIHKCVFPTGEPLNEDYEGKYTCKDGHIVKSKSEVLIDNFLFENGILHAYEKKLPYGKTEKEVLHPDFFLKDYLGKGEHVYIEHWGYNENNKNYTETKKFKIDLYKKLGITLVCTNERKDIADIDATLERKLNKNNIVKNEINDN